MNQLGTWRQTKLVCRVRILTNPVAFSRFIALWGVDAVTEELASLPSKAANRSPCQRIGSTESPYRIGRRSVTNDLGMHWEDRPMLEWSEQSSLRVRSLNWQRDGGN